MFFSTRNLAAGKMVMKQVPMKRMMPAMALPCVGSTLDPAPLRTWQEALFSPSKAWEKARGFVSSVGVFFKVRSVYRNAKLKDADGRPLRFGLRGVAKEAQGKFEAFCLARAAGDLAAARRLCTEDLQSQLDKLVPKHRADIRGVWEGMLSLPKVEKLRFTETSQDKKYEFVQATLRMRGSQRFRLLDAKTGKLVAGSDELKPLNEVWVFERPLQNMVNTEWRLQGRVPDAAAAAAVKK